MILQTYLKSMHASICLMVLVFVFVNLSVTISHRLYLSLNRLWAVVMLCRDEMHAILRVLGAHMRIDGLLTWRARLETDCRHLMNRSEGMLNAESSHQIWPMRLRALNMRGIVSSAEAKETQGEA